MGRRGGKPGRSKALGPAYQIARLRIEAGLTQAQLAEMVGTKQPGIARLESGQTQPTLDILRRLAAAQRNRRHCMSAWRRTIL